MCFHKALFAVALIILLTSWIPMPGHAANAPVQSALPVVTSDPVLDAAEQVALTVLERDAVAGKHIAAPYYNSAWIRDSFAWGTIPWSGAATGHLDAYDSSELAYWLGHAMSNGLWITNPYSGWYDETPILISAAADAYRLNDNSAALATARFHLEAAWAAMRAAGVDVRHGSRYLLFARLDQHIATDWADQIKRQGYATQLEALWYHATRSMAEIERALGRPNAARHYDEFARGIRDDVNKLLWGVGRPTHRNALPVAAFGHYKGWLGGRDYFELDANFLCIVYGIASKAQAAAIMRFTLQHAAYLLGTDGGNTMPARTVYGDYDPRDYARIHDKIGDGVYQNAYWPSVGILVANGFALSGDVTAARMILRQIARLFIRDQNVYEWYRAGGAPSGAAAYQWPARLYVYALYAIYLGLNDRWLVAARVPHRLPAVRCAGTGNALIVIHGTRLAVKVTAGPSGTSCPVTAQTMS
jgi:hypothetical protein